MVRQSSTGDGRLAGILRPGAAYALPVLVCGPALPALAERIGRQERYRPSPRSRRGAFMALFLSVGGTASVYDATGGGAEVGYGFGRFAIAGRGLLLSAGWVPARTLGEFVHTDLGAYELMAGARWWPGRYRLMLAAGGRVALDTIRTRSQTGAPDTERRRARGEPVVSVSLREGWVHLALTAGGTDEPTFRLDLGVGGGR